MDTSPFAYEHALRNMRRSRASSPAVAVAMENTHLTHTHLTHTHLSRREFTLFSPLVWLYRLFIRFTAGETNVAPRTDIQDEIFVSKYSRDNRRFLKRKGFKLDFEAVLRGLYIDRLMFAGLSPTQKQEKLSRMSGRGRIAVYGLRYWGTTLQARARLKCYDHGWWRRPFTSAVADGLWEVQLPPN